MSKHSETAPWFKPWEPKYGDDHTPLPLIAVACNECRRKFTTRSMLPNCPKCGGFDAKCNVCSEPFVRQGSEQKMAYQSFELLFRSLTDAEEAEFIHYAETHDPDLTKWEIMHPVCRRTWSALGKGPVVYS
mgnify:CR=1 FL=1